MSRHALSGCECRAAIVKEPSAICRGVGFEDSIVEAIALLGPEVEREDVLLPLPPLPQTCKLSEDLGVLDVLTESLSRLVLAAAETVCGRSKASPETSRCDYIIRMIRSTQLTAEYFNVMLMGYSRTASGCKRGLRFRRICSNRMIDLKAASTAAPS